MAMAVWRFVLRLEFRKQYCCLEDEVALATAEERSS
jgi:hypothetical protein